MGDFSSAVDEEDSHSAVLYVWMLARSLSRPNSGDAYDYREPDAGNDERDVRPSKSIGSKTDRHPSTNYWYHL